MIKTNAARMLDRLKIYYEIREYEVDESDLSVDSVAPKIQIPLEQIFKTLVTRGDKTGILIACVPGHHDMDLKELASVSGNRRVELVPLHEVQPLTGYIRGGVSPLGMRKKYPTYLDETALRFDTISISAGQRGAQLLIDPKDLVKAVGAKVVKLG
jgi:Cys-tRNA(Pro)/Cys-tRNA(Cys) deacylase